MLQRIKQRFQQIIQIAPPSIWWMRCNCNPKRLTAHATDTCGQCVSGNALAKRFALV